MRIATYNVNSIRARIPAVREWLQKHEPDILCLQETKVKDSDFPAAEFAEIGYHALFRGEKSYNGVAILSRTIPDEFSAGFNDGEEGNDETRLIHARFGDWHVVNTYVPQGRALDHEMYTYKLRWFKRLRSLFDRRFANGDMLIWAGDMNVARTPLDVAHPENKQNHVCHHVSCREAFEECVSWGFEDLLRRIYDGERVYTFFDYRVPNAVKRGIGWRIDYIQASPPAAARFTNVWIDVEERLKPKCSDHTYLVADFND